MRGCRVGLFAGVIALAGCKAFDSKSNPAPDRDRPASAASRTKDKDRDAKGPSWLDAVNAQPGAGTAVPKAGSWADPKDPKFDPAAEAKGMLAGVVLDTYGRRAPNASIHVESAADAPGLAPVFIATDADGYFQIAWPKPGVTYTLTAQTRVDGKPLVGVVQTRAPKATLTILLREDDGGSAAAGGPTPAGGLPPPPGTPAPAPSAAGIPPPSPDLIPPTGTAPPAAAPPPLQPDRGAGWSPGGTDRRPAAAVPPSLPPAPIPAARPGRPENTADGPRADPWKAAPPTAIPGPGGRPAPAIPAMPPPIGVPPPPAESSNRSQSRAVRTGAQVALVDTLGRGWDFDASRSGRVVLLDFMTTTCVPCAKAVPALADLQARYGAAGLEVVGVVCDKGSLKDRQAAADKYHRARNLNYGLYVEPGSDPGRVQDRFKVTSYPTVVLLDAGGNVLWRGHPHDRDELERVIRGALARQ